MNKQGVAFIWAVCKQGEPPWFGGAGHGGPGFGGPVRRSHSAQTSPPRPQVEVRRLSSKQHREWHLPGLPPSQP